MGDLLQGHQAAGQNSPAERESGRIGAGAGGIPTPTRPTPGPPSAAPEWERGQSPGLNAEWQTAVLEGAGRCGVRAGRGSRTSLGGEGSAQPAPSPPLGPPPSLTVQERERHHPAQALQTSGGWGVSALGAWLCPPAPCSPWPDSPAEKALRQDFKGTNSGGIQRKHFGNPHRQGPLGGEGAAPLRLSRPDNRVSLRTETQVFLKKPMEKTRPSNVGMSAGTQRQG